MKLIIVIFVQKGENSHQRASVLTKSIQNDIINCNCRQYARTMLMAREQKFDLIAAEPHGPQGRVSVYKH